MSKHGSIRGVGLVKTRRAKAVIVELTEEECDECILAAERFGRAYASQLKLEARVEKMRQDREQARRDYEQGMAQAGKKKKRPSR